MAALKFREKWKTKKIGKQKTDKWWQGIKFLKLTSEETKQYNLNREYGNTIICGQFDLLSIHANIQLFSIFICLHAC